MSKECAHCGEACLNDKIRFEDKNFCCTGCKTVYQILNDQGLDNYYKIENTPGISKKGVKTKNFDFLENESVRETIYEFSDGITSRVRIYLPSIHCSSCIWLLENLDKLAEGVVRSRVNFVKKQATIVFKEKELSLKDLLSLLDKIGYTPDLVNSIEVKTKQKTQQNVSRSLIYKIGIAGFSFGNIMLLSFPEYLDVLKEITPEFARFFRYLSFLFALPVVFYSAKDYFVSAYKSIRSRYLNIDVPISIGIITLFLRSTIDVFYFQEIGYFDSLAGLVFFLLIGKWFQEKTYNALSFDRDFKSFFPLAFKIEQEDKTIFKTLEEIEVDDIAIIRNGEVAPADSILLSKNASIDYSFVTGESLPVHINKGAIVFAGGQVLGESAKMKISKAVSNSYLIKLWNENDKHSEEKLLTFIDKISRNFTFWVLAIAFLAAIYWGVTSHWHQAINIFSAVLIVACPCALALAAPFTFGHAIRYLGKRDIFFKNTSVLERLAKASTLIFDKTGTLTNAATSEILFEAQEDSSLNTSHVKQITRHSTHPLSRLLSEKYYAEDTQDDLAFFKENVGKGLEATIDTQHYFIGSFDFLKENNIVAIKSTSKNPKVYVGQNGKHIGTFIFKNKYRAGVFEQIKALKEKFKVLILSGDNDSEKEQLHKYLGQDVAMHFNQSPFDKKEMVEKLQKDGAVVCMFGDGLNDAGALAQSEIGISLIEDIGSFSPASDIIIKANKISAIKELFDFSKACLILLKCSLLFSLLYNLIGLSFAVTGKLTPLIAAILMPISSISVVLFVTLGVYFIAKKYKI